MKDLLKKQWRLIIIVLIFYLSFFVFYNEISFSEHLILSPAVVDLITSESLISPPVIIDLIIPEPLVLSPVVVDSITLDSFVSPPVVVDSIILDSFNTNTVQTKINLPVRLKIPVINVDAFVEHVGLTSTGEMGEPKDAKNVAWFELGALPGLEGNAVIAGHLDDKSGRKAVFYDLKKINKGDQLFVEDNLGQIITFVVREIRMYDSEAFAPEIFSSNEGRHLNLITCAGNWNKSENKYTKRLVVFTEQVIQ